MQFLIFLLVPYAIFGAVSSSACRTCMTTKGNFGCMNGQSVIDICSSSMVGNSETCYMSQNLITALDSDTATQIVGPAGLELSASQTAKWERSRLQTFQLTISVSTTFHRLQPLTWPILCWIWYQIAQMSTELLYMCLKIPMKNKFLFQSTPLQILSK